MELNTVERLTLLNILPMEGTFITLKLVRELREMLSFDELELKRLSFVQEGDQARWDESGDTLKDCGIGEKMTDLIVECLKKLDDEKKLNLQAFSLYEKFVIQED
ncbi:hypothetical protein KAR91_34460 [Candidatus Pacearchaeota archaeon]|nr:hypothetical protein [Candidatus Pacearchaeota archaeon]